ncbi:MULTISPECIES: hypothetical protein [Thermus]|uniref:Uncharacterized protein n=1 Tax=Thermus tengchongensis TaxID=1214928 RepID=A0A4Y9FED5_9DEIN|nr:MULTISPECIES: hypothetical protein [Thermus]TFU18049.1 hypothetical protein E0489_00565 [Thermus tengchongensis]TFU27496.1 hypothetical protein E0687_01815 [Thermus tengchongensis]
MSLDDLLGLLFLLFFIVIPALQGLSRRGQPPPTPPGFPEDLPLPEPLPRPKPKARPKPKPRPTPPPSQPTEAASLERYPSPERTPLEVSFRATPSPEEEPQRAPKRKLLATDGESILKGVIWHEILKRPKGW